MDSQDSGVELTDYQECHVGHPYGSGEGHNHFLHAPNGKTRGRREHVLRGNGRQRKLKLTCEAGPTANLSQGPVCQKTRDTNEVFFSSAVTGAKWMLTQRE
jgi:hypothetical protein